MDFLETTEGVVIFSLICLALLFWILYEIIKAATHGRVSNKGMKKILIPSILLLALAGYFVYDSNRRKNEKWESDIKAAKFEGDLKRMKTDLDDLKTYLDWESDMKNTMYRLGYTEKKAQAEIDSIQQTQIFKYQKEWPDWYKRYLSDRDSVKKR